MKDPITIQTEETLWSGVRDGYALLELARGWLKQGNPVVAVELLKSAISSPDADQSPELRARLLKEQGRAYMMQSKWEQADTLYLEAQRVFHDLGIVTGASECARNRANLYFQRGEYMVAEQLCETAIEWLTDCEDHELRATILNTLAAIKSTRGEFREALKVFKLCLSDFQSAGNNIRQGYTLLNIGLVHTEIGEFNSAILSLKQALSIALDEKDQHLVEICYQNVAKCYLAQRETYLAKSVIDTARKILPGLNSSALECELNLIDCRILRAMGDLEAAEELLSTTHELSVNNRLSALEAEILLEQGLVFKDAGRFDISRTKLDAAANQFKQLGLDVGYRESITALEQVETRDSCIPVKL